MILKIEWNMKLLLSFTIFSWITAVMNQSCENMNNLTQKDILPKFTIKLETPPEKRWYPIATLYKDKIQQAVKYIQVLIGNKFYQILQYSSKLLVVLLKPEYISEMKGIALGANVSLESVVIVNVFYELSTLCTSIVAKEGVTGKVYHARNLDFGIGMGYNMTTHKWILTEHLKNLSIEISWMKNEIEIARSTQIVGYIGFLTAFSHRGFSYSINQRITKIPSIINLIIHTILQTNSRFIGFVARELILNQTNYDDALKTFSNQKIIAPCYITIASSMNKAAIITRSTDSVDNIEIMDEVSSNWYLYVTNYDKNSYVPFFDTRNKKCEECIPQIPHNKRGIITENPINLLLNVLSTKPILNKLTIHSTVTMLSSNLSYSYSRYCSDPCPLF